MNVIANNCIGGELYKDLKYEFNNPFMWTSVPIDKYLFLTNNYNSINWNNVQIEKCDIPWNKRNHCYKLIIDNNFEIYFRHYVESKKNYKNGVDVFQKNAFIYTYNKYKTRLNRMVSCNEEPIFLFYDNGDCNFPFEDVKNLIINSSNKYKMILVTYRNEIKEYETDTKKVIIIDKDRLYKTNRNAIFNPGTVYHTYSNEIKNELKNFGII